MIWSHGPGDDLWELRMTMEETMERTISLLDAAAVAGEELLRVDVAFHRFTFATCTQGEFCLLLCLFCLSVCVCCFLVGSSFTQCNSCLPTARGSLPLTRAGIFTGQSTFSDRRSFVRVAAVAQKKKRCYIQYTSLQ